MIIKPPKTDYEKRIYQLCKELNKLTEGEKSIIYDLITIYLPNYANIDFNLIDLEYYVNDMVTVYDKYKNYSIINLINTFIKRNNLTIKNDINTGGKNNASENITSK